LGVHEESARRDGGEIGRIRVSACVLVVEDDLPTADAVAYAFERDGLRVLRAELLERARPLLASSDVVVLDLTLPDGSGFSLLREIQKMGTPPRVVVLTSHDDEVDCVAALEAGADDYVTKPFSPRVLVARARAVLRRRDPQGAPVGERGLIVEDATRKVSVEGWPVDLTKIEFDVLSALAAARGRVLTRGQLVSRVWGDAHAMTSRTVDSHIKALRRKLKECGARDTLVETVRGVGFRLRDET
jgi:DNA-binding response OmpR family regulator